MTLITHIVYKKIEDRANDAVFGDISIPVYRAAIDKIDDRMYEEFFAGVMQALRWRLGD